jgi:hypothetical protein
MFARAKTSSTQNSCMPPHGRQQIEIQKQAGPAETELKSYI